MNKIDTQDHLKRLHAAASFVAFRESTVSLETKSYVPKRRVIVRKKIDLGRGVLRTVRLCISMSPFNRK